jgi:hypothetical protein
MKTTTIILCSVLFPVCAAAQAGQDPLASAKTLYESAAYEAALKELSAIDGQQYVDAIDTYRALCFLGLGRTADAEHTLEVIVRRQPLLTLSDEEYSPRLVALFREVRKRVLPAAARQLYASAKSDFDDKNYASASRLFKQTLDVIAEVESGERTAVLGDLKQLSEGFLLLADGKTVQASIPAAPPTSAPLAASPAATSAATAPSTGAAAAGGSRSNGTPAVQTAPFPSVAPAPASAVISTAAAGSPVYSVLDAGVTPPIASEQRLPPWNFRTGPIARTFKGRVEMIIDEAGAVESVTVLQSVFPPYDNLLQQTAKRWRYLPAVKDGKPVRFRKVLDVNIDPTMKLNPLRE